MLTQHRSRKRPAKRRSARGANPVTPRTLLAGAVAAATLSALAGIAGRALALDGLQWLPPTRALTAGAPARYPPSQRRVSLPRETTSQRHDILQRRTQEAASHRAARAVSASPYRFMIPPQPGRSPAGPANSGGSEP